MEIKYDTSLIDTSKCVTMCPFGFVDITYGVEPIKVGSQGCGFCTHFVKGNYANKTVTCNYPGEVNNG